MLDIQRNNLDISSSPYLRQHAKNPIWWQEWSSEIIEEAIRRNKPLFVSVGYATCHWCHVMAADAFSDRVTAEYLNLAIMLRNGLFHFFTTKKGVNWSKLPPNSLQMRGEPETDCYRGICRTVSLQK
ncbi:MAG: thioredoxin domain-containing protein [Actinomycetia bacterium]|nr:thioredoxin domain-containing protein [Actinomycetes bacterium]